MKKIYVEAYALRTPYVGVGEFCKNLCAGLARRAAELKNQHGIELYFVVPQNWHGAFGDKVHYVTPLWNNKWIFKWLARDAALLHLTHQYCKFGPIHISGKQLMTIHDINFMYEKQGLKRQKYMKLFRRKLKRIDCVNFISAFTKQDTEAHFTVPQNGRIIYNGVKDFELDSSFIPSFYSQIPSHYLFHISSLLPKKNVHLLIEMMRYLPNENLIIAGDWEGKNGTHLRELIQQYGLTNVYPLHHISEEEKYYLYRHSKLFLFPSLCEGFGLPPIESMKQGTPVMLSRLTSLPEIGGELAFYWDHLEPKEMAKELQQVMERTDLSKMNESLKQYALRFNWERCTDEYIHLYVNLAP